MFGMQVFYSFVEGFGYWISAYIWPRVSCLGIAAIIMLLRISIWILNAHFLVLNWTSVESAFSKRPLGFVVYAVPHVIVFGLVMISIFGVVIPIFQMNRLYNNDVDNDILASYGLTSLVRVDQRTVPGRC